MVLQVRATFPEILIKEPVIHNLSQKFRLMTNILAADVQTLQDGGVGWVQFDISGDESEIESGISWMVDLGVRVERLFRFDKEVVED